MRAIAVACLLIACEREVTHTGGEAREPELLETIDTQFGEPSGLTFHPSRKTLFVVTDEGDLGELRTDGTIVQRRHLLFEDFEGITCDPATGLLYIVIEGRDNVLEVDPDALTIRREFDIDRRFMGETLFDEGGNGLEGIAFVPNPQHPHGGTFFLVNRSSRVDSRDDPPLLIEAELPLRSRSPERLEGSIISHARLGIEELSGLWYDAPTRTVVAVTDKDDLMIRLSLEGDVSVSHALGVESPEGIAFDDEGYLYIASDRGSIVKMRLAPQRIRSNR